MPLPLFALFVAAFAVGTTEMVVAGLLPALAADLAVDIPTAGLLITGYALGVAVGGPILILGTGRLPRRGLLIAMMLVFVLGNGAVRAGDQLLAADGRAAGDLGEPRCVLRRRAGHCHAPRVEGRARQALYRSSSPASPSPMWSGAPLGTAIGNAFGWRMAFWAIAGIGVVATVALAAADSSRRRRPPAMPPPSITAEIRAAFRLPVLTSFLMIALGMIAFFMPFTFIVPILTDVTGLSIGLVPVLLFVSGVGGIFGNFLGGRLGDWKPMPAMVAILALEVVLYLAALPAVTNAIAMGIVLLLWSLVGFSFSAPVQARILNAAHDAPNLVSTLISTAYNIGIAAGAWLGGVALNAGWHYAQLPGLSAVFVGIALVIGLASWAADRPTAGSGPEMPVDLTRTGGWQRLRRTSIESVPHEI